MPNRNLSALNGAAHALNGKSHSLNGKATPAKASDPPQGNFPSYAHILVPTALIPTDRAALLLGLQMAVACRAQVTLLHVVPPQEPASSVHWLDAIDNLHRAIGRPGGDNDRRGDPEAVRGRIMAFLEQTIPGSLRAAVTVNAVSRQGEVAREIARFADQATVDLVILGSSQSAWKLPLWPGISQRVLRQTTRKVILVRPDANDHHVPGTTPAQVVHP